MAEHSLPSYENAPFDVDAAAKEYLEIVDELGEANLIRAKVIGKLEEILSDCGITYDIESKPEWVKYAVDIHLFKTAKILFFSIDLYDYQATQQKRREYLAKVSELRIAEGDIGALRARREALIEIQVMFRRAAETAALFPQYNPSLLNLTPPPK